MAQDFKNLKVWEEAHKLTLKIYKITKTFPDDEKFGLVQQIRRAVSSIELNIAEGTAGSRKLFIKYLLTALGSCKEVECCNILIKDLGYITQNEFNEFEIEIRRIQGMLTNFIKVLKGNG